MFLAQGCDFSGQKPDEPNAVDRRAGNEVVVPTFRHSVYGCVFPVHAIKVPFLSYAINRIVAPNGCGSRAAQAVAGIRLVAALISCKRVRCAIGEWT